MKKEAKTKACIDDCLARIRIVLVEPSHPGNIGGVARALKNMGISRLYLVQPRHFPHAEATARAAGADDLLARAVVVDTVEAALVGCARVFATSARERSLPWPIVDARVCAEKALALMACETEGDVAILFGNEQSGLPNTVFPLCHYHVIIPTCGTYSALNLAAAVQVIAYELYRQALEVSTLSPSILPQLSQKKSDFSAASTEDMLYFYVHLERVLMRIGFLKGVASGQIMPQLRRLFHRAQPQRKEMKILRGILSYIEKNTVP